jgi:hypothetical protein
VIDALADAETLGEYFRVATGPGAGQWRPAADAGLGRLPDLIGYTAGQLGTGQDRVAVSIAQLGYAARLWSPSLACALRHGIVPDLSDLQISIELPVRLRLPRPAGWQLAEPGLLAWSVYRSVVDGHLGPLAARLEARVASGLLYGNAASAMIGALAVIADASPELAGSARTLAELLLGTGRLRGTGSLTGQGLDFRRHSCCLYYRLPSSAICADCCFPRPPPLSPAPGPHPPA